MKLGTYRDFLERVDELGFMAFSRILPGLPCLSGETAPNQWHTGEADTDPWCWKDRAAEEGKLAYGCILNGHKGFVSSRMYPVFYAAYHPAESMPELRAAGLVNQTTWELWQLFEQMSPLNTGDIRFEMGVTAKRGGSRVDAAIRALQRGYYITVIGNQRKVDKTGCEYGWPACLYDKVTNWTPPDWLRKASCINPEEACETILDNGMAIGRGFGRDELAKSLGLTIPGPFPRYRQR